MYNRKRGEGVGVDEPRRAAWPPAGMEREEVMAASWLRGRNRGEERRPPR